MEYNNWTALSSSTDQPQLPAAPPQQRRKRFVNGVLVLVGIVMIIGCFVMASYSYIFLEDCDGCSSEQEIAMAKVFRFLSAGFFLIGVFLVAFSLCTFKEERDTFGNSDLRRISLQTVACVIPESAKEKSPAILHNIYSNPGLNCSSPCLNEPILELPNSVYVPSVVSVVGNSVNNSNNTLSLSTVSPFLQRVSSQRTTEFSAELNPPPSYSEALIMRSREQSHVR